MGLSTRVSAAELLTNDDFQYKIYESSDNGKYISLEAYLGKSDVLKIPETIDGIPVRTISELEKFSYPQNIKKVIFSKNTVYAYPQITFSMLSNLESFEVAEDNPTYYAKDGVLFSKY